MKKIKLFSIVLLLILSVGVLGMGIYAASPANHTVSGKIEIVGSKYPVTIETWIEGLPEGKNNYQIRENLRAGGQTFTFDNLNMNFATAQSLYDTHIVIAVKVTNLSNKELGAFFLNPENQTINEETGASRANLFPEDVITDEDGNELIDVYLTFYKQIGVKSNDSSVITDEATLYIEFAPKDWIYDDYNQDLENLLEFGYTLVIEEYKPNVTDGEIRELLEFSKISSTYEGDGYTADRTTIGGDEYSPYEPGTVCVVLPNGLQTIADGWSVNGDFLGIFQYGGLEYISLPNSLVSIEGYAFWDSGLKRIEIPSSVTSIRGGALSSSALKSVYVDPENPKYYSQGNCVIETGTKATYGGEYKMAVVGAANAEVPSDVTVIGDWAFFANLDNNQNLEINCASLKYIGQYAFGSTGGETISTNIQIYIPDGCYVDGYAFLGIYMPNTLEVSKIVFGGDITVSSVSSTADILSADVVEFLSETFPGDLLGNGLLDNASTIYVPKNCGDAYKNVFNDTLDAKVVERS